MAITLSILNGFSKFFTVGNFQQSAYTSHHTFSMLLHYLAKVTSSNSKKSKNCVTFDKNWNVSRHTAEYGHNSCWKCPPFCPHTFARTPLVNGGLVNAIPNMQKMLLQFTTLVYTKSSDIYKQLTEIWNWNNK